jgi:IS30 family transposase
MLDDGVKPVKIAKVLKVHKSTVSREMKRRRKNGRYDADAAEHKATVKRSNSKHQGMKIESDKELRKLVVAGLKAKRSPDEIAGRMKKERRKKRIGTNAIYKWLYSSLGARYCKYLCTKRKKKKPQKGLPKREMIPNRVSIHDKPKKKNLLELEGDTFVSGKRAGTTASAFLGSVGKIHLLVGTKVPNLKCDTMVEAVNRVTKEIDPDFMILDNGIENKHHEDFNMEAYFCDPHAPWQKPRVECDIGLLRRWFIPKGTDLRNVSEDKLQEYLHVLNGKYRKSLGYMSPYEAAIKKGIIEKVGYEGKILSEEKVAIH